MRLHRSVLVLFLVALASCRNPASSEIEHQFSASNRKGVDLATDVPGNWDRVCILGPYSSDDVAAQTLGFEWPAENLTDIASNDGISLLIFVRENSVLNYVEHPRGAGDFSNLTGRCFPHAKAKFVQRANPTKGWPGLFPVDEF